MILVSDHACIGRLYGTFTIHVTLSVFYIHYSGLAHMVPCKVVWSPEANVPPVCTDPGEGVKISFL